MNKITTKLRYQNTKEWNSTTMVIIRTVFTPIHGCESIFLMGLSRPTNKETPDLLEFRWKAILLIGTHLASVYLYPTWTPIRSHGVDTSLNASSWQPQERRWSRLVEELASYQVLSTWYPGLELEPFLSFLSPTHWMSIWKESWRTRWMQEIWCRKVCLSISLVSTVNAFKSLLHLVFVYECRSTTSFRRNLSLQIQQIGAAVLLFVI